MSHESEAALREILRLVREDKQVNEKNHATVLKLIEEQYLEIFSLKEILWFLKDSKPIDEKNHAVLQKLIEEQSLEIFSLKLRLDGMEHQLNICESYLRELLPPNDEFDSPL